MRLIQLEKVMKQYLIRIVFVSEVGCKFSFVTFNMAPLLGISFSFSDLIYSALSRTLFFHQILTNIPSSMTSTIFLSIIIKISPHVHTSLPPCWLPLPFDSQFNTKVTHNSLHCKCMTTTSSRFSLAKVK